MKMLSGKSVLIAVFLQLCFYGHVVKGQPYQFGDILEFPHPGIVLPFYSHYAVYVGGEHVEGKREDQNIFEMIREPKPGCRFDRQPGPFTVANNKFDSEVNIPQSKAGMRITIEALMNSDMCQKYNLIKGNCEHVATMVRYGIPFCNQKGTIVWPVAQLAKMGRKKKRREASAAA